MTIRSISNYSDSMPAGDRNELTRVKDIVMPFQAGPTSPSPGSEALVARYREVRAVAPDGGQIAVLHVGPDETGVAVGASVAPAATIILGIGSRKTANDHFRHSPPSPGELELGIMVVEDEVTRVLSILGGGAELFTTDAAVRAIAPLLGQASDGHIVLTVEQVESAFERLAAVSLGRPAAREGIPEDNEFAATLLIVREFMHHLGFSRITIL